MTKYTLTKEHEAQLPIIRDKYIANAMSTKAMDDEERQICREAVDGLYRCANIQPPKNIVFVPSPFVLRFAAGFAVYKLKQDAATYAATCSATHVATDAATRDATDDATYAATIDATHAATYAATYDATCSATYVATDDATDDATIDATHAATHAATCSATDAATHAATCSATHVATHAATRDATDDATCSATHAATHAATCSATDAATHAATYDATYAATHAATYDATYAATCSATDAATRDANVQDLSKWYVVNGDLCKLATDMFGDCATFALESAKRDCRYMWQGGNQWSGEISWRAFFMDVVGWDSEPFQNYRYWRTLGEHAGPRCVHKDFAMICDRPEVLLVDEQNRPHCEDGAFCKWRDGSMLFAIHGVRTPAWVVLHPERITPDLIWAEENNEVRRIMIERYGAERLFEAAELIDFDFQVIDEDQEAFPPIPRGLYKFPDDSKWMYCTDGGTDRCYCLPMPDYVKTCKEGYYAITGRDEKLVKGRS